MADIAYRAADVDGLTVFYQEASAAEMRGGFLHITQQHPGIQRGGDKRAPKRVRPDALANPGAPGGAADDPRGAVPVQPPPA